MYTSCIVRCFFLRPPRIIIIDFFFVRLHMLLIRGGGLGAPRQAGRRCTPGVTALRGAAAGPLGFSRVRGVLGPWIGARGAAQRPGGAARLGVHPSLISPVTARRPVADWLSESAEGWRTKGW